ncbi:hypothetical protein CVH13_00283, partial [Dehalococcoides mccartyi]
RVSQVRYGSAWLGVVWSGTVRHGMAG